MPGMRSFSPKQRREQRRRNHIAKDLNTPKYKQRRVENKKRKSRIDKEAEDTNRSLFGME
jgi:hypothetical protein